jgi:hypothetical protein
MTARRVTYPLQFPWCMHKNHTKQHDITRMVDPMRIWLQPCGGIRTERR